MAADDMNSNLAQHQLRMQERTFALLEGGSNTRGNLTAAQEDADWEDVQPGPPCFSSLMR